VAYGLRAMPMEFFSIWVLALLTANCRRWALIAITAMATPARSVVVLRPRRTANAMG
jgi:hypothetical protein